MRTATCPLFSTGIAIPSSKKGAFEERFNRYLCVHYRMKALFMQTKNRNYEIKLKYLEKKKHPASSTIPMSAQKYILKHLPSILKGQQRAPLEVINIDNAVCSKRNLRSSGVVDLTHETVEPEVIVLDDSLVEANETAASNVENIVRQVTYRPRQSQRRKSRDSDVQVMEITVSSPRLLRSNSSISNDVTVIGSSFGPSDSGMRTGKTSIKSSTNKDDILLINRTFGLSNCGNIMGRKSLRSSKNKGDTLVINRTFGPSSTGPRTGRLSHKFNGKKSKNDKNCNQSPQISSTSESFQPSKAQIRKNKKRKGLSQSPQISSTAKFMSAKKQKKQNPTKKLTPKNTPNQNKIKDSVAKYYERINKAIENVNGRKKKSPVKTKFMSPALFHERLKSMSPLKRTKAAQLRQKYNHKKENHRQIKSSGQLRNKPFNDNDLSKRIKQQRAFNMNFYNPNPHNLEDETGLRPIVIDGNNVAMRHSRGEFFSVRGLQIVVDYFHKRGHKIVKVFLPQHREEKFSADEMKDLKSKCNMIFTPDKSYDDRFMVQYAADVGGVIVSEDMYRDLMEECDVWKRVIQERLLRLTWVDDVLIFPLDPGGRRGQTLVEFLQF